MENPWKLKKLGWTAVGCWVGCSLLCGEQSVCWAKVDGDLSLLEQVVVAHVSNREKIATWEGDALVETYDKRPGRPQDERTAEVYFAYDRDRNAWLYRWSYVKSRLGEADGWRTAGMFVDNTWYGCPPWSPTRKVGQGLVISAGPPPTKFGPLGTTFYPMYYFKVRGDDFEDKVKNNWFVHADSDWLTLVIRRDTNLVTVEQGNVNIPFANAEYVFDLSQSGNLVSLAGRDDQREVRWTYQWEQRAGVWIPKIVEYSNQTHDKSEISKRTVTWRRSVVNEPLPEDTFTLDTLQVAPGALVSDHRVGKSWHYKEEDHKEASKAPRPPASRRPTALIIVSLNLLALIVVLGILVWRRRAIFRR